MNLSPVFTIAARTETAYNAAQDWIANDAPIAERRLKQSAIAAAVAVLEFALIVIDWLATEQLEKAPEYQLRAQLRYVLTKRFAVRQGIAAARFNERYQITATAAKVWSRRGAIATSAMDKVFSLN